MAAICNSQYFWSVFCWKFTALVFSVISLGSRIRLLLFDLVMLWVTDVGCPNKRLSPFIKTDTQNDSTSLHFFISHEIDR
jgi:hypothetical protein